MSEDFPDRSQLAEGLYDPNTLPVLNARPLARCVYNEERFRRPAPKLFSVDQLIGYFVSVHCAGCEAIVEINEAELAAKGKRVSFQHLATLLTCSKCGGQAAGLEITRKSDRGLANHQSQWIGVPMCGRYTFTKSVDEVRGLFGFRNTPNLEPRYNIAPTQMVPAVLNGDGGRDLVMMRWGLIPAWAKDEKIAYSTINARLDSVATKPAFKNAFKSRRCLVLADGFYEWEQISAKEKQPWRFTLPDGSAFAFAGLWENWKSPAGETIITCTIITTEPYPEVKRVHDRSPVILHPDAYEPWLSCQKTDGSTLGVKTHGGSIAGYRVSKDVGSVKNQGRDLIDPIA